MMNAEKALEFVKDGDVVGLGSGRAAANFIRVLGKSVQAGLRIQGVPTSAEAAALAAELGIPLTTLEAVNASLDVTVDGADEVDPHCNLIKGLGGALVREKIVAAASRQFVILIGPDHMEVKDTTCLGTRGVLPVEVVPFGLPLCKRRLAELGCPPTLRLAEGRPFLSDNGNFILDCKVSPLPDLAGLEQKILSIPGVVGTGLFIGMADAVLIQRGDQLEIRQRKE
jgi:ribose 5-phosphate isomerase A